MKIQLLKIISKAKEARVQNHVGLAATSFFQVKVVTLLDYEDIVVKNVKLKCSIRTSTMKNQQMTQILVLHSTLDLVRITSLVKLELPYPFYTLNQCNYNVITSSKQTQMAHQQQQQRLFYDNFFEIGFYDLKFSIELGNRFSVFCFSMLGLHPSIIYSCCHVTLHSCNQWQLCLFFTL